MSSTPKKTAAKKATAKKAESPEEVKGFFTHYREMFEKDTKRMAQQHRFSDLYEEYLAYGRFLERHPEGVSA